MFQASPGCFSEVVFPLVEGAGEAGAACPHSQPQPSPQSWGSCLRRGAPSCDRPDSQRNSEDSLRPAGGTSPFSTPCRGAVFCMPGWARLHAEDTNGLHVYVLQFNSHPNLSGKMQYSKEGSSRIHRPGCSKTNPEIKAEQRRVR